VLSETEEFVPSRVLLTLFQRVRIFGRDRGLQPSELFSPAVQDGTDSARSVARLEGQGAPGFRVADDSEVDGDKPVSRYLS
jgi:hypothetical protein